MRCPESLLLIPDGNRRWARKQNLSATEGYTKGIESIRSVLNNLKDFPDIKVITIWALSPKNRYRNKQEIDSLMSIMNKYIQSLTPEIAEANRRIIHLGSNEGLPNSLIETLKAAEKNTADKSGQRIVLAINYSGEQEISDGAQLVVKEAKENKLFEPSWISMKKLIDPLKIGEVDLLIRTGGERRTSGFGWRADNAELYFTDTPIADFSTQDLKDALRFFATRDRRNGK